MSLSLKCVGMFIVDMTKWPLYRTSEEAFLGKAEISGIPLPTPPPPAGRGLAAEPHPALTQ